MFSPLPVAGSRARVRFTTAAAAHDSEGEETEESPLPSLVRKLKFTQQSCITPGRYAARHQLAEPLRVVLRLRPCDSASDDTAHQSMEVVDDNTVLLRAPVGSQAFKNGERESRYTFSSVLDENCSQEKLYRSSAAPLVESLVDGHNGLIFAYGITNSGKTHSIRGSEARPGILFRSIDHLFQKLEQRQQQQQTPFAVWLSYLEIYNDKLYDLLSDDVPLSKRKALRLVANKKGQVYVNGLREVLVGCGQEARAAVAQGERNRQVAETVLNADSSRSHCVFSLKLVEHGNDKDLDGTWSKLCIVDLAGAERSSRTNASKGERFREASKINTSLMQLGRCLDAVRWNQAHPEQRARVVPFRDSKTTRLFKDFFSGWGRTTMIATANPSSIDHDETAHALRFAALAREVRCVSKVNSGLGSKQAPSSETGSDEAPSQAMELDEQQEREQQEQQEQEQETSDSDEESLLDQIFELKKRLVASERARADIEQNIRGELSEEMTAHLQSQETLYRTQLDQQCARAQRLAEKKLELWKKRVLSECGGGVDESRLLMDVRSQAQREIDAANEEVRAANARLQEAANDAQQRIDSANQQKNEARETLREAQLERMELVSKLREKRTDHELMRKRIEELSELCEERKRALQEARTIADKQQSGVAALEAGALSHAEERTALQQLLHEQREKVAQLQLTIDAQQSQLMEADAQRSELEQELHDRQRQLDDRASDTLDMRRRLETEGTALLEAQQQLEAEATQRRQLEARVADAEQAQDKLQQQLVEAQKLVQNANSTCNDLGQSLAARDRSIAELHDTVNDQQSKLQKLLQEQAERDAEQQRHQKLLHHQAEEQRHQMQLLQTRLQEQEQEHERQLREKAQELQGLQEHERQLREKAQELHEQEALDLGGIGAQQHVPIPFVDDVPMEPDQEPIPFVDDAPMEPDQEPIPLVDDAPMEPDQQEEEREEEPAPAPAPVPVEAEVTAPAARASRSRKRPQRARQGNAAAAAAAPTRSRRSTRSKKPIDNIVLTEDESDVAPVAASVNENTSSRSSGSRRALSQKQPQSQPEAKPEAEIKLNKAVVQVDKTKLRAPIRLTAADKENIQRQTTKRKTRARAQQPTYLKRKVEKTWKADEWASLFEDPFAKPSSEEEPEPSPKRVRTNELAEAAAPPPTRAISPRRTRRRRRQP